MSAWEEVYLGFWTNWTHGRILGGTLTLSQQNGAYLIAFLALFVRITGGQCWQLLCWIVFQLRARPRVSSTDAPSYSSQQQAILRNSTSPTSAIIELIWAQRKWSRQRGSWLRTSGLLFLAATELTAFLVAAIFSSQVRDASSAINLRPTHCGEWHMDPAGLWNVTDEDLYWELFETEYMDYYFGWLTTHTANIRESLALNRECENDQQISQSSQRCTLPGPQLPSWSSRMSNECPFGNIPCASQSVILESGSIDSHMHLGINAPPHERLSLRRKLQCAPLQLANYTQRYTAENVTALYSDFDPETQSIDEYEWLLNLNETVFTAYLLGNSTPGHHHGSIVMTSSTYHNSTPVHSNVDSRYSSYSPFILHNYWHIPETSTPRNYRLANHETITPIPDLSRRNSSTSLLFLENMAMYQFPVHDPWFNATYVQEDFGFYTSGESFRETRGVLACFEDISLCNPALPDRGCIPLGSDGAPTQSTTPNILGLTSRQDGIFTRLSSAIEKSSILEMINLGGDSMLARSSVYADWHGQSLPDNQWTLELERWFSSALLAMQLASKQYTTGYGRAQYNDYKEPPLPEDEWMCNAQVTQSIEYSSFNVLGLSVILVVGLLIIIANWSLPSLVDWIRSRQPHNTLGQYRAAQWRDMELLELHRKAWGTAGESSVQALEDGRSASNTSTDDSQEKTYTVVTDHRSRSEDRASKAVEDPNPSTAPLLSRMTI